MNYEIVVVRALQTCFELRKNKIPDSSSYSMSECFSLIVVNSLSKTEFINFPISFRFMCLKSQLPARSSCSTAQANLRRSSNYFQLDGQRSCIRRLKIIDEFIISIPYVAGIKYRLASGCLNFSLYSVPSERNHRTCTDSPAYQRRILIKLEMQIPPVCAELPYQCSAIDLLEIFLRLRCIPNMQNKQTTSELVCRPLPPVL